jgi:rod shape-determining protein MreC
MFSKRMMMIVGAIVLIAVNIIVLSANSKNKTPATPIGKIVITIISPFQEFATNSIHYFQDIWRHYFYLVTVSKQNDALRRRLEAVLEKNNALKEMELSHERMRELLGFQSSLTQHVVAAEVVGKDPSAWFKTVIINKGKGDGINRGMPVVTPGGIAGLVTDVSKNFSKVLLVIDQNSAVDALTQNTRARGIIKGDPAGDLTFEYILRRHDINKGDVVISSGLDNVFPKGLRIGYVQDVFKPNAGIFQQVKVTPYVDFEKLEEVLVVLDHPKDQGIFKP